MTSADRFYRKVDKEGPVPEHVPGIGRCHIWTGCLALGYGQISYDGKVRRAHRLSFYLTHGRWPVGCVMHRCDNTACVNPEHLVEGTQLDNIADRCSKRRSARGERSGQAKLSDDEVREIVHARDMGVRATDLATKYGVTVRYVRQLHQGIWRRDITRRSA